jgi:hypothetical protein
MSDYGQAINKIIFKNDAVFQKTVALKPRIMTRKERFINRNLDRYRNRWDKITGKF